jgi:hypothetical protein
LALTNNNQKRIGMVALLRRWKMTVAWRGGGRRRQCGADTTTLKRLLQSLSPTDKSPSAATSNTSAPMFPFACVTTILTNALLLCCVPSHGCPQNNVGLPSLGTLEQVSTLPINPHEHTPMGMRNLVHAQSSCQQA